MARYYDMDKLKEMILAKADTLIADKEAFLYVAKWLDLLPAADVVPKSEYDAVVSAVDNSTKEFLKLHDTYQEQKTEVVNILDDLIKEAREIANRYEKSAKDINDCDCSKIEHEGRKNGALIVLFKISEFKKKYMGETKHENESKA